MCTGREYRVYICIDSPSYFRHPPAHMLDIVTGGLITNSTDELNKVLLEVAELYRGRHRPSMDDITSMVQHIQSCSYGVSRYIPTVPMSYNYMHRGMHMIVRHVEDNGPVLVNAQYSSTVLVRKPYGRGELRHFGPDTVSKIELWRYIDRARALDLAYQWIAKLNKRFPGVTRVLQPDILVDYYELIRVIDDDRIMMLFKHPAGLLLATPIGWFVVDSTHKRPTSIFSLLRSAGISYPRTKQARRWTENLGLQLLFTFRLLSGDSSDICTDFTGGASTCV